MKKIIGFTDQITECECCGKTELKGTYCIELDGVELYYGSTCAFKEHGLTQDEQKTLKSKFKARLKTEAQFQAMETANNGTAHYLVSMLRFVRAKKLDLQNFVNKYGKEIDGNDFYKAYKVGHEVVIINNN